MRLKTLGSVRLDGSTVTRPKPLLLLAYLTLEGPVTRREAADLFFPTAADPRDSLATDLRYLRTHIGPHIDGDGGRLATSVPCDAADLLADFDAYRYGNVVQGYEGAFFEGVGIEVGVELEEWLYGTRELLARRCRTSRFQLARAALVRGELRRARHEAEAGVGVRGGPELDEHEIATVLPLLEFTDSALATHVKSLAADLELPHLLAPRSVEELVTQMHPRSPHVLPGTPFVGRSDETARIVRWLREDGARLVTIYGMGGMGKTRLAARVAEMLGRDAPDTFPDGVHFVALETVEHVPQAFSAIAARLGLPAATGRDAESLGTAMSAWRTVVVLDDLEHLPDAVGHLPVLLHACPHLRLIVTSRTRLGLSAEHALRLEGLSTTPTVDGRTEAADLFRARAAAVGFVPNDERDDGAWIDAICAGLEGYPLGIELAAGLTRMLPPSDVARELRRSYDALAGGASDAPNRHRAIRSAFEPSWDRLGHRDRDTLCRLTAFRGGFQLDAAEHVAHASLSVLARLSDRTMLRVDRGGRGRFDIHPLIHAFVASKADPGQLDGVMQRHAAFYLGLLERSAGRVVAEPHEVLARLDAELANVLHAIRWARGIGDGPTALRLTELLVVSCDYLQARGGNEELLDVTQSAIATAVELGHSMVAHLLATRLGDGFRELRGDLVEALRAYEYARDLAAEVPDPGREAILTSMVGAVREELTGEDAEPLFGRARDMAEAAADDLALCLVLQKWGYLSWKRGQGAAARQYCLEAIHIAGRLDGLSEVDQLRADQATFYALHNLGVVLDDLEALEASLEYRRRAVALAEARDNQLWTAYALEELGVCYHRLHDRLEAETNFRQALTLYRRSGAVSDHQSLEDRLVEWGYA